MLMPSALTNPMMASAMAAAIRQYSMAVAPDSSARNSVKRRFSMAFPSDFDWRSGAKRGDRGMPEPPQEQRRDHAGRQRRQRGIAQRNGHREPDQAEHDRRRPEQADQDADIDGNALAAPEFRPDREDMAEKGAEPCQH